MITTEAVNQKITELANALHEAYQVESGFVKEVMTSSSESEMIPSKIYDTVIESVKANLVLDKLVARKIGPRSIPGSSITVVLHTKDSVTVQEVAEGSEIPIDTNAYESFTLTPVKYGYRPLITNEMIEDNQFDVIAMEIAEAGYQFAKKMDSILAAQIEAGAAAAGNTVSGADPITVANIVTAMNKLEANDFTPTDMILSPEAAADIRNIDTFVEADKAKVTDPSKRLIGTIFGMKVWVSSQVTSNYVYIIDRNYALITATKRPLTIENYKDNIRDMKGIVFTMRWTARYLRAGACAVITSS